MKYSGLLMKITTSLHPTWVIKYILFNLKTKKIPILSSSGCFSLNMVVSKLTKATRSHWKKMAKTKLIGVLLREIKSWRSDKANFTLFFACGLAYGRAFSPNGAVSSGHVVEHRKTELFGWWMPEWMKTWVVTSGPEPMQVLRFIHRHNRHGLHVYSKSNSAQRLISFAVWT